jgi:hypothetical protein
VAESLVEIDDPLAAALDPGESRAAGDVVAAMAGALAPSEAVVVAPEWLRPEQVAPLKRVIAALDRYGAAMLADPPGSGKTYVALAVARARCQRRPVAVIAPAVMRAQWQAIAARLGLAIVFQSHETVSRGVLPNAAARLVIVDESHRFRNPGTARYGHLARWLPGRRLLLLTATPVVNRLVDLGHQLLLGMRSDALAIDGVPDLLAVLHRSRPDAAFGRIVLCRPAPTAQPRVRHRVILWRPPAEFTELLARVDHLALSSNGGIAALIRMTLWRALSSSLAALAGALRRYRSLLEHAQAASRSGRQVTRDDIRRFSSTTLDQLVMWDMLPQRQAPADLVLRDISAVDELIKLAETLQDPRLGQLAAQLQDGLPTIVFTASRDTLHALRAATGGGAAWICGSEAGIGTGRLPPASVLGWFRPQEITLPGQVRIPHVLLATDVAAEGLDLQRAARVVHFDLPWTPMRIDQREGRAVRLGNLSPEVEVARWTMWPALEARLHQAECLWHKRRAIGAMGIDEASHWLFRWRSDFVRGAPHSPGFAAVRGESAGWLVAVAFDRMGAAGAPATVPAELLWVPDEGAPIVDPRVTTRLLADAAQAAPSQCIGTREVRLRLADWIRSRMQAAESSRWLAGETSGAQRRLIRRLQQMARTAAGARDERRLNLLQAAVQALAGGLSAGEVQRVQDLLLAGDSALLAQLAIRPFPVRERVSPVPRLCGLLRINFPA